jgi:hypothetical protein
MKIIKILSIITFVLILLEGFAYINILTSEKYEVDLLETHNKVEGKSLPDESIEAKKKEISMQKKRTKIELVILSTALIILLGILIYNSYKSKLQP